MPELPEVETIRRSLAPHLAGVKIEDLKILYAKILKQGKPGEVIERVKGQTGLSLERRGKYLIWTLDSGDRMIFHLRMTGRLLLVNPEAGIEKHTSLVFSLDSGKELRLTDIRKFAMFYLWKAEDATPPGGLAFLGPEPLEPGFTARTLEEICRGKTVRIKNLLLDQTRVAGIGNIYADESLFRAGIHPLRNAGSLQKQEIKSLYQAIRTVLKEGITFRGTTRRDYLDGLGREGMFQEKLAVYGRKGEKCPRCNNSIQRSVVGGRGTYFCPYCQRKD